MASVGTGLGWPGWYQPPPPQRSQGVQGSSSERPGVRQPEHLTGGGVPQYGSAWGLPQVPLMPGANQRTTRHQVTQEREGAIAPGAIAPANGGGTGGEEAREPSSPVPLTVAPPLPTVSVPFMGQMPKIPRFTGEGRSTGESFSEWHEHFENVAKLVGWWKLVHLTSNLQDTALAFFRSCSADVRSKYVSLVTALKQRFTPIRLTAVQAKLFHNRQQSESETVDQFAQELRKLYNLAYAGAASEGPHAERMGQTLLANQFVAGLRAELKRKLIGVEGGLDELILKARFEEAKSQELTQERARDHKLTKPTEGTSLSSIPPTTGPATSTRPPSGITGPRTTRVRCYNCGMEGHVARFCPYPRRSRWEDEARGSPRRREETTPQEPQRLNTARR